MNSSRGAMNYSIPDWTSPNQPKLPDSELMELLWCNGHVVMQSQTARAAPGGGGAPSPARNFDCRTPPRRPETPAVKSAAAAGNAGHEDDPSPWFHYSMLDDALEKDFFSDLFSEMPAMDTAVAGVDAIPKAGTPALEEAPVAQTPGKSSSMVTIGSSIGGSSKAKLLQAGVSGSTLETTVTSSTEKSRQRQQSTSNSNNKRKATDMEESDSHSEEAEFESAKASKPAGGRTAASRRSRAAEVHNLSERRRRDRINEKMRALQELIPHCNKTDKASMLDEAIEYLKSLQLQVQMMWMGSGMAQVMFHGVHLPHFSIPANPAVQLQRVPYASQAVSPNSVSGSHLPNHLRSVNLPEQLSGIAGLNQMQLPPQAMNYYPFGPQAVQQIRSFQSNKSD